MHVTTCTSSTHLALQLGTIKTNKKNNKQMNSKRISILAKKHLSLKWGQTGLHQKC